MQELLRIGDFSQLAQVTVPTLRHYNELGLLTPAKIDPFTDYRYYSLDQLPRLHKILALKDMGFALEQIKILLTDNLPPERLRAFLEVKRKDIETLVQSEQARLTRIEARLRQIEHGTETRIFDVVPKPVSAQTLLSFKHIVPLLSDMRRLRKPALEKLYERLAYLGLRDPGPEIVFYDHEGWTDENINMLVGVNISKKARKTLNTEEIESVGLHLTDLPEATAATITHRGPLWDIPECIIAIFHWAASNGYASSGPIRESHLTWRELDQYDTTDPVVFEIQLPVERLSA